MVTLSGVQVCAVRYVTAQPGHVDLPYAFFVSKALQICHMHTKIFPHLIANMCIHHHIIIGTCSQLPQKNPPSTDGHF